LAHEWTAHNARPGSGDTVQPARPEVTRAPRYTTMVLHFGGFSSYETGGMRGTHQGGLLPVGGSGAGCAVTRFKLQPSATVGEHSKGQLTTRLGHMGAAQNVEHQRRVDGARGASHVAWR
jgi:hypothetical protein